MQYDVVASINVNDESRGMTECLRDSMSEEQDNEMDKKNDESKNLAVKDACIRLLPNCAEGVDVIVSPTEFGCNKATFKASVNGNGDYFV